jgi:tRNA(Ile)-lysidine synthase
MSARAPVDPALVARFRRDVERLRPIADGERIALAVSGGPDSMAMLALAAAAYPGGVIAATVDHRLRSESADEAAMVAGFCAAIGVEHVILSVIVPPGSTGNLHAWARQQRYLLLKRWTVSHGAAALATAHHGDDQAETFLMRAARGSGVAGLAAVRERRDDEVSLLVERHGSPAAFNVTSAAITLLRPLLTWRRSELRAIAANAALPFVDDPSNIDERFDRARFRRWVESAEWIDPLKIARAAAHVAEADSDLEAVSRWLWSERALPSTPYDARLNVGGLPREVRRRLAQTAIAIVRTVNGPMATWDISANVESLLDALESGKSATQAGVMASAKGDIWHFREEPPRRAI